MYLLNAAGAVRAKEKQRGRVCSEGIGRGEGRGISTQRSSTTSIQRQLSASPGDCSGAPLRGLRRHQVRRRPDPYRVLAVDEQRSSTLWVEERRCLVLSPPGVGRYYRGSSSPTCRRALAWRLRRAALPMRILWAKRQ